MSSLFHRFKQSVLIATSAVGLALVVLPATGAAYVGVSTNHPVIVGSAATRRPSPPPPELRASYSTIDVPGAFSTEVTGIIRTGPLGRSTEMVGIYQDAQGIHGFVLSGGHYTTLDYPGSDDTWAEGISSQGQIVGYYSVAGESGAMSFRYSQGIYTSILPPGYNAWGINASGDIVATYQNQGEIQGSLSVNGAVQTFGSPGESTFLLGINNDPVPEIVGFQGIHGVVFNGSDPDGGTTFDVPGPTPRYTAAYGVNDSGQIVGAYALPGSEAHGFVDNGGSFSTVDCPGTSDNEAHGIDNPSPLTGSYDIVGTCGGHGFIATVSRNAGVSSTG